MVKFRKYPCLSTHETLLGSLNVDWDRDYKGEFQCPRGCGSTALKTYWSNKIKQVCVLCTHCEAISRLSLKCSSPCLSTHETLHGTIEVNWKRDYIGEFQCPAGCSSTEVNIQSYSPTAVRFQCRHCQTSVGGTCSVPQYIYNYRPQIKCPNPICADSWSYEIAPIRGKEYYYCRNCHTKFSNSDRRSGWLGREQKVTPFQFDDDSWHLRNFFENSHKTLNFGAVTPLWYQTLVKQYLHRWLKARTYSDSWFCSNLGTLRQFGQLVAQQKLRHPKEIQRTIVLAYLSTRQGLNPHTVLHHLTHLSQFFDWLELNTPQLIHKRDYPKTQDNDVDWLEEEVRKAIRLHLDKIPPPIARQYRIQEHIAARPGDVNRLPLNCLMQDGERWYVQLFQGKVKREHRVPATREIRRLVEEQQQWIQTTFGADYPYLFCHFRNVRTAFYPTFPGMKALPDPPSDDTKANQLVRVIRMLIEQEDIRDNNGKLAYFTGKITRSSRLQEVRERHGIEVARAYADHKTATTTLRHYAPPTREQVAKADLPFQVLLLNQENRFLPWQSLPESLLKNPAAHELDIQVSPRLTVYGYCALDPKQPCPKKLYPLCYACSSFRPCTDKLLQYEQQYAGEQQRMADAEAIGAEVAYEEAKSTTTAMEQWLPELRNLAHDE